MNFRKILFATLTTLFVAQTMLAIPKKTKVYIYGLAFSFNDSTVYFTDIQEMDTCWVDSKTKFLYNRENYSYQLQNHLKETGVANPTCVTTFSLKRKDIEKKYIAIKKKYGQKEGYNLKYVTPDTFKYTTITPDENELNPTKKKVKKKKKKEAKPTGDGERMGRGHGNGRHGPH